MCFPWKHGAQNVKLQIWKGLMTILKNREPAQSIILSAAAATGTFWKSKVGAAKMQHQKNAKALENAVCGGTASRDLFGFQQFWTGFYKCFWSALKKTQKRWKTLFGAEVEKRALKPNEILMVLGSPSCTPWNVRVCPCACRLQEML